MAKTRLVWRGDVWIKELQDKARRDVLASAILVEGVTKASMKLGGTTESGQAILKEGTKSVMVDPKTGKKVGKTGDFRSKPGEVPRVQSATLKRSITHWLHTVLPISRAGTNVKYGKWLEFGTKNMSARPFMRPALHKSEAQIKAIFEKKMRDV